MAGPKMDIVQFGDNNSRVAHGGTAVRLLNSGFDTSVMRTNDVLRKDEWKRYDDKVIEIARQRLVGVGDLISRGLSFPIENALGVTQIEWEGMTDMTDPEISMSGVTEGERDRLTFALHSVPLPIVHKDFRLNVRHLEASRRLGQSLDTTQAAMSTRLVSEKLESILFNGAPSTVVLGSTIYGYTTAPNRNTGTLAASWETGTTTGTSILDDTIAMITALQADHMYGPYGFYVTVAAYNHLLEDFKASSDKSILSRLLEIPDVEFVKPSSNLATGAVVAVQFTSDVVDLVDGMQPQMVQWEEQGGMVQLFKVMAIMVPRVKSTESGQSGIAHYTP